MKLQITKDALVSLLSAVAPAVARGSKMPILTTVRLIATDGTLAAAATDLDLSMQSEAKSDVTTPGAACVGHGALLAIAKALPAAAPVAIEAQPNHYLRISSGRFASSIVGMNPDEYPKLPKMHAAGTEVDASALELALSSVAYAMSRDETRFVLNSVRVEAGVLAATDGHRLALLEGAGVALPDALLPRHGIEAIRALCVSGVGPLTVAADGGMVIARRGSTSLAARLIDGKYPDVAKALPAAPTLEVAVDSDALLSALRRIALVASARTEAVVLDIGGGVLRLSSQDADKGEAAEELAIEKSKGKFRIGFNGSYLADAVAHADAEAVTLRFVDELSPGVVVGGKGQTHVVMPMRV